MKKAISFLVLSLLVFSSSLFACKVEDKVPFVISSSTQIAPIGQKAYLEDVDIVSTAGGNGTFAVRSGGSGGVSYVTESGVVSVGKYFAFGGFPFQDGIYVALLSNVAQATGSYCLED